MPEPEDLELHQQLVDSVTFDQQHRKSCPFLGILLATVSSLFFSLCSVIVKFVKDVDPMQLAMFRFFGVLLPAIPIVIYTGQSFIPSGNRLKVILALRCFVGATSLMLSFYAFRRMPLADASVIIFSTPVFVAIFAHLFLKEPCGLFNVLTICLTLLGIMLITRPRMIFGEELGGSLNENDTHSGDYNAWGPVAAFSSTIFGANAYVLLRALKDLHFSVIMVNFGAFSLVYTLIVCLSTCGLSIPPCNLERLLILALAVFSFGGQILLTKALQMEQAGPVSIARSSDIVFAFIWQILFFKEIPNRYSVIGAVLVTISVLLSGLRKWVIALPRDSLIRQRLHLLTVGSD